LPSNDRLETSPVIIDDLVDDALSSASSSCSRATHEHGSMSSDDVRCRVFDQRGGGGSGDDDDTMCRERVNNDNALHEQKRLIEQELAMIRREREHLLLEHGRYRQEPATYVLLIVPSAEHRRHSSLAEVRQRSRSNSRSYQRRRLRSFVLN
jgi:hypothetical protein